MAITQSVKSLSEKGIQQCSLENRASWRRALILCSNTILQLSWLSPFIRQNGNLEATEAETFQVPIPYVDESVNKSYLTSSFA